MADAVVNTVVNSDPDNYTIVRTNLSDGTGESAAIVVDLSGLSGATKISVKKVQWASQGFTYFNLGFDHTTDDVVALLPNGVGELDYGSGKPDPQSAGGTGDLVITTVGHDVGDTYTMVLTLKIHY